MDKQPLILLTNDDGVWAKGLNELINCLHPLGEIVVMAPDGARSGMSGAITSGNPIKYKLVRKEEGLTIYSCTGTPVDCVKLTMNVVLDRKPDLLVSGINHGCNMAICVQYSGTLGAAAEGCIFGIPSLGTSLTDPSSDADFTESCRLTADVCKHILQDGLPYGTYLNLNIPDIPAVKGLRIGCQAKGKWVKEFMPSQNPMGEPVYWLTGHFENADPLLACNDAALLDKGYATLVPCKIDVTDHQFMEQLKGWEN
ncbi:MAG: 5'/3'-nucleotidase SurE [Tannerellaceae bacterium]|nr:5'/3'-nucleotidase SurE [Tannerellaceae bacterium]MCD8263252.1 5'/3'-nucleotidase SurE [Tannerellaceae bacterium]